MTGRLTPLTPEQMNEAQRALYESIVGGRRAEGRANSLTAPDGSIVGPFDAYLRSPLIGTRLAELGESLRYDSVVPRNLLELAIIVVGRHWTAQFEWYAHSRMALAAGVDPAIVEAIAHRQTPTFSDPAEAAVYRFASQLVGGFGVDDATYDELVERLGEQQVFELTAVTGFYCAVSAVLNTFRVPLPEGVAPLAP